jgi:TnpA family transposase
MIYWHVERKSVCIYSQLKSCSASEVASMIEGVLRHCTDMEVDRQYTDTHGTSIVGFAFAPYARLQAHAQAEEHRLREAISGGGRRGRELAEPRAGAVHQDDQLGI